MKLSIVIPCFNEEKNISLLVSAFREVAKQVPLELILVDNGSRDGTRREIQAAQAQENYVRLAVVEKNQGYGYGISAGLREAQGDFWGWTHADLQSDPRDILTAYELLQKNQFSTSLFIKGRRYNRPSSDRFFTLMMAFFESVLFGRWLYDISAQPNILPRAFFSGLEAPHDFAFDLYCYIKAKEAGLRLLRFPVKQAKRQHGFSSWNNGMGARFKLIKRILSFSWKLRFAPSLSKEVKGAHGK